MAEELLETADTFEDQEEPKSSKIILDAIDQAERVFQPYNDFCRTIDDIYSSKGNLLDIAVSLDIEDQEYDLFWSSIEILKPAIYAKPPKPVATPRYKDGKKADKVVAELMERVLNSEFERSDIDQVMLDVRDDLALVNRGAAWVTYESKDDESDKRICIEHLDRNDFLHEPARKWAEVGWVARRAWMTKKQLQDRFGGDFYNDATYSERRDDRDNGAADKSAKAGVWEVWHRGDNQVYWVTPGVDKILEEAKPHLNLRGFFPCPRPAYGTIQRRSLIPVPDYKRYLPVLKQINELTSKVYDLLKMIKVAGLVPAGGDVGSAIEAAIRSSDSSIIIPVPGASFGGSGGTQGFVQWLPNEQTAATIQGLLQARGTLIEDFYQLSGISDIMRGATEADETLGAQRLKSQYGSVRVRDKIDELVRLAKEISEISAEIICDNFDRDTLLDISQMDIPTKADIKKDIAALEKSAKQELEALADKAEEMSQQAQQSQQPVDPNQAQQQFQQAQQAIIAKYQPQLQQLQSIVPIEDVMEVIKDRRTRNLVIDIETDSTVMVDELAEKQSRSDFLTAFAGASQAVQPLLMAGEAGAKLAGAMLKFALQPFKANRELDSLIDEFIEEAPKMAAQMQSQNGEAEGLAEANKALAEAEQLKAQAAMAGVQAKSALDKAETQRKMAELQMKAMEAQYKAEAENAKLQLQMSGQEQEFKARMAELDAKQNLMQAQTAEILAKIGLDVRKQDLEEYRATNEQQQRQVDTALALNSENRAERGEERADRQQLFSEVQGERQMTMAERQAMETDNAG